MKIHHQKFEVGQILHIPIFFGYVAQSNSTRALKTIFLVHPLDSDYS